MGSGLASSERGSNGTGDFGRGSIDMGMKLWGSFGSVIVELELELRVEVVIFGTKISFLFFFRTGVSKMILLTKDNRRRSLKILCI